MNELALREDLVPMTAQECAQVIGLAAATDPRIPQPSPEMLTVWYGILKRVPYEAAEHALADWYGSERYRETRDSISPADIAGWWRDRRRHVEADRVTPPFDAERIRRGVDLVAAACAVAKGLDPDVADGEVSWRRQVLAEPCPWEPCHASAG